MYTLSFKEFHWTTYDSLMIYFSCEQALKSNLQIVWTNWIKNTVPSSLNIKDHKLASYFFIQKSVLKVTNLQTFVGRSTDHQNFLHVDSEHPKSLKDIFLIINCLKPNGSVLHQITSVNIVKSSKSDLSIKITNRTNKQTYIISRKNRLGRTFKRKRQYHRKRNKNSA